MLDLSGHGNGGTITIGGNAYVAGPEDRFVAQVKFPRAMPYVGLGYRTPPGVSGGWGLAFDLGLSVGRAKVTGAASGPQLSQVVSEQDVQQELEKIRHDANRLHGIPQLSIGANYRF